MLVLTRKTCEKICIPVQGVTITVFGIQTGKVRIGVSAPCKVRVWRAELLERGHDGANHDPRGLPKVLD
jgi:carbon storage regulator CsrA